MTTDDSANNHLTNAQMLVLLLERAENHTNLLGQANAKLAALEEAVGGLRQSRHDHANTLTQYGLRISRNEETIAGIARTLFNDQERIDLRQLLRDCQQGTTVEQGRSQARYQTILTGVVGAALSLLSLGGGVLLAHFIQ